MSTNPSLNGRPNLFNEIVPLCYRSNIDKNVAILCNLDRTIEYPSVAVVCFDGLILAQMPLAHFIYWSYDR